MITRKKKIGGLSWMVLIQRKWLLIEVCLLNLILNYSICNYRWYVFSIFLSSFRGPIFQRPAYLSMPVLNKVQCGPRCMHSQDTIGVLRRGEARITRIAMAIVWLFIFCHMWRLIPNAYELFFEPEVDPVWILYMIKISHTLIVFNSAVNVLLYKVL